MHAVPVATALCAERLLTTTPREGFDDTPRSSSDKLSSSRTTFSKSSSGISTIDSNFDDMKSPSALQCEIERLQKVLNAKKHHCFEWVVKAYGAAWFKEWLVDRSK